MQPGSDHHYKKEKRVRSLQSCSRVGFEAHYVLSDDIISVMLTFYLYYAYSILVHVTFIRDR